MADQDCMVLLLGIVCVCVFGGVGVGVGLNGRDVQENSLIVSTKAKSSMLRT